MLVAGPNLSIDRIVSIGELRPGEVLRLDWARVSPGGKGLNVARAAAAIGVQAPVVTFVAGRTGRAVADLAADEGLELVRVEVGGEARAAIIILEPSGRVTVLNEPGPELAMRDWERFEAAVQARAEGGGSLVCTGSLPPGSPEDAYARLVAIARRSRIRAVVDAAGPALRLALDAGPDVVTPNLTEARDALGWTDGSEPPGEAAARASARLVELGASVAVVTAGEAGLAWASDAMHGGSRWLPAPPVRHVNPIGAGDSFVAGLVARLEVASSIEDAVVAGAAMAAASVETQLPGQVDRSRVGELEQAMRQP